jgi:hypothetical protein
MVSNSFLPTFLLPKLASPALVPVPSSNMFHLAAQATGLFHSVENKGYGLYSLGHTAAPSSAWIFSHSQPHLSNQSSSQLEPCGHPSSTHLPSRLWILGGWTLAPSHSLSHWRRVQGHSTQLQGLCSYMGLIKPWFSKCRLETSSSHFAWELGRNAKSPVPHRMINSTPLTQDFLGLILKVSQEPLGPGQIKMIGHSHPIPDLIIHIFGGGAWCLTSPPGKSEPCSLKSGNFYPKGLGWWTCVCPKVALCVTYVYSTLSLDTGNISLVLLSVTWSPGQVTSVPGSSSNC